MSTRSGFTLLEVLVALTIVVTAWAGIAAALPRLVGPSPAERAALAVEGVLRQAREAAQEGRAPVTVRLDDGGRTVAAPSLGARADLPADIVARLEGVRGWGSTGGAFAANDEAAIVFLPDGSSSGGRVTLSDRTLSAPEAPAASSTPAPASAPTSTPPSPPSTSPGSPAASSAADGLPAAGSRQSADGSILTVATSSRR